MTVRAFLKEPLAHFLLAGGALFLLAAAWGGEDETGRHIGIDREDLLVFMQGRAQVYDEETFAGLLDRMSAEERQQLVRDAALQKALYREGQALDLASADPLVRQRVVQQMRLLLMEEAAADMSVSEEEVREYFAQNGNQYRFDPSMTFTHVFFQGEGAQEKAAETLKTLRGRAVPFEQAGQYGERFLYQLNYSDASQPIVASHFGEDFARAAFALETGSWQGPVRSEYGWHVVLPVSVDAPRSPAFADVADRVREDALAEKRQQAADRALDTMLARYEIDVEDGILR
ncbi:peptidyl-prolyl cis-trans isomerase [Altericroceibacterium xinjiangense]|uniref:peptidylprolyl isomerase n=1 Tax=Altericroceibacterium xinjiangense TaxID=762261 RepID=UPI000F7DD512|nr:peptidylprolyl isomerase [Altericroceibacterium xinjiangense]